MSRGGLEPHPELDPLLEKLWEQALAPEDEARFRQLLKSDAAARQRYLVYTELHGALYWEHASQLGGETAPADSNLHDTMVLPAVRPEDAAAIGWADPANDQPAAPVPVEPAAPPPSWAVFRASAAAARRHAGGIAAVLVLCAGLLVWHARNAADDITDRRPAPQGPVAIVPPAPGPAPVPVVVVPVAVLSKAVAVRWDAGHAAVPVGAPLEAGRKLALTAGALELTFTGGARVVVEGPATLTVESPTTMALGTGRLAARAEQAGFVVRTPTVDVTDRGTEFGVDFRPGTPTTVEVFEGAVEVAPRAGAVTTGPAWAPNVLGQGQAASVEAAGVTLDPRGAWPQNFVRRLDGTATRLDVVDLIAGGDGTTRRRGVAVNPSDGTAGTLPAISASLTSDGTFHAVQALPVIDGCFIPDGRQGATTVDSAGRTFAFPESTGLSFGFAWAGGVEPGRDNATGAVISAFLGGVDYAQDGHSPLFMHTNKGLTINLEAVRRLHPGRALGRFRCVVGNSYVATTDPSAPPNRFDAFVLVDGRAAFEKRGLATGMAPVTVDVPLPAHAKSLTIATTDGGDDIDHDWVVIGDPVLEFEPVK